MPRHHPNPPNRPPAGGVWGAGVPARRPPDPAPAAWWRRPALFAGALACAACCNPPENIGSQSVTLRAQQTSMWCWAASGQMVMEFLGVSVAQGEQANKRFGRTDCLDSPIPGACVRGGWPEFDKYGFTFKKTSDAPLEWAALKSQIYCRRRPFAFTWHWVGGGGHMMVATGYATLNGTRYVSVNDPWEPDEGAQYLTTYDEYVSGTDHTHWDDYYDVTKR